ncbi:MAG: polyribonucleotide nucleotidyltransferase [Actinomycetota bacterium]|nr:polyribonucleotide nucleotidyltransferase [Actinomycetota bacterium]
MNEKNNYIGEDSIEVEIGGKIISFSTGKLAKQTNGSVLVKCGSSGVLVTSVMSENADKNGDYFPLVVDVEERMYAAGKIPGGFFKREGKASDKAILLSRLTDRPLRPLFDKNFRNEVQIVATILSVDQINPFDVLVINGASMALMISDIPFQEPIGAVRVGKINNEYIVNPNYDQIEESSIDIIIAGTENAILMVEAGCNEVSEQTIVDAIGLAHAEIKKIIEVQKDFQKKVGLEKKQPILFEVNEEVKKRLNEIAHDPIVKKLEEIVQYSESGQIEKIMENSKKGYFQDELKKISQNIIENISEEFPDSTSSIEYCLKELERKLVRRTIIDKNIRPDGRKPDEIRPISCEVGLFPETTHGTGLFTRGKSQALTILALGSMKESQRIDSIDNEEFKRFMHHYNFPAFSVGETGMSRGPKRREIGHGALAERAIKPMIPSKETFPYSLRLVSEILSSNGSTSMASVCGSTLALMDAGVPITNPVSGIAMGLVKDDESDKYVVLTDIQGIEDFYGDMDFKVAGTENGITALQMDIKIKGISVDIIQDAIIRAKEGRMFILRKMLDTIPHFRENLSSCAPKITTFRIPKDKIGEIIGPGGKNIKAIKEEFDLDEIELYDEDNEGVVQITSANEENVILARKKIEALVKGFDDINMGDEFLGTVVGITKFGAFINLIPGIDGLLHISKISDQRVEKVEDFLKLNEKLMVKVSFIDKKDRKISLERA